jgi:HK97 family phage portal protein
MIGLRPGEAYASYFPTWEVTAPQYPQPSPYSLQDTYRTNEVAYACIELLMDSISEPPILVVDKTTDEELKGHDFTEFMKEPCPLVDEVDFWKANMMFLSIAGFMGWEQDTSNDGSIRAIYPIMPQYSSFMRGQSRLLDRIRYQPYTGMPYMDINIDRVLYWMYPDPRYYGLKPLGPTARLTDIIPVDTAMTQIVGQFLRNGAFISGQLVTDQIIDAEDARFAKERFRETQGGPAHAGEVLVTGKGMKFERMNNTFREMVFPEVDARNEVRICMAYGIKPILISAKVGMDRSTMNNYEEARRAQYHEKFTSLWRFLEKGITRQLLPLFDKDPNHVAKFDLRNVEALQENRTEVWKRATEAYKARVTTRNDTLKEMGLNQLDDKTLGNEYFTTTMSQTSDSLDVADNSIDGTTKPAEKQPADTAPESDKAKEEEKAFRIYAKKRVEEKHLHKIGLFEFKYVSEQRQRQLLSEFGVPDPDAEMVLKGLLAAIEAKV